MSHALLAPTELHLAEAHARILSQVQPIQDREAVPLAKLVGRILAEPVLTPHPLPLFDNAAMDGYAFRSAELDNKEAITLRVVGTALAGHPYCAALGPGEAVRIMTGAPLPIGADRVVMLEDVEVFDGQVRFAARCKTGHVRRQGEDLAAGAMALPTGQRCSAVEVGLLASLGLTEAQVFRRVRVALFSSGDELTAPGATLAAGTIYDSNRFSLMAALQQLPCEIIDLGTQPDEPAALAQTLRHAADSADIILTSGGVSTGDADFIPALLAGLGEVAFWKLALKPGRPMAFGQIGAALVFGLPGNPIAALVTFSQLVRDAILRCAGCTSLPQPLRMQARCTTALRKSMGRREFIRATLDLSSLPPSVTPDSSQGSAMLKAMSRTSCFIVLTEEQTSIDTGDFVEVRPYAGLF